MKVHPNLQATANVVDAFERATGAPPACLISQPSVRAAYVDLIDGPEFSQNYVPEHFIARVSFRGIPWHIDLDCKPDTVCAMPPEYRPQ